MVESLPLNNVKKNKLELRIRFLQAAFQKLFDSDDNDLIFKLLNMICHKDTNNDSNHTRPDGWVENDNKAVGYFEVKPIEHAKNHKKSILICTVCAFFC